MYLVIKRFFDFSCALFGLLFISPIFLTIMIILWFANDGQPFFVQNRVGYKERVFNIFKFRTMNNKKDAEGNLLPDEDRLTPIGIFIRKTSLDELPQLINIIKGEMSFIGPRPLLIRYIPFYKEEERIRHTVKPGITGLAQVSGRNNLGWDLRLGKDIEYVKTMSFANDFKILLKTIRKVILVEDVVLAPSTELLDLDDLRRTK